MPHAPKVCVRTAAELKGGGEVHGARQLLQDGQAISTNNTQETKQLKPVTEITVEFTPLPSKEAKMEMQKSEEELKEGKDAFCKETHAQVEKEKLDNQTDDKNELGNEIHSKNTDDPHN